MSKKLWRVTWGLMGLSVLLLGILLFVPAPLRIRGVTPAVGSSAGGDKVMLDAVGLNQGDELAVYFGSTLAPSVALVDVNSIGEAQIEVVTPAYSRDEVVDIKVTQKTVGEPASTATLEGAFQYVTPATLEELMELIAANGEESTIRALSLRGIQDMALVSGGSELTKVIDGEVHQFDVDQENYASIGSVVRFSARYRETTGFMETDQNLEDFKVVRVWGRDDVPSTSCDRCKGRGSYMSSEHVTLEGPCLDCGKPGHGYGVQGHVVYLCPRHAVEGGMAIGSALVKEEAVRTSCFPCDGTGKVWNGEIPK